VVGVAFVLAGCGGGATPRAKAERLVQTIAKRQGLRISRPACSGFGAYGFSCNARVIPAGTYVCSVNTHDSGACFLNRHF